MVTTHTGEPHQGMQSASLSRAVAASRDRIVDNGCPVAAAGWRARLVSMVVHAVFVVSGISALIYQLIWQRALLVLYGSNTESVALVVTAFMLGLGLGSIVGGEISKRPGAPLVVLFSATEFVIGLYGVISLRLFHWVAGLTVGAGTLEAGVLAFGLVLLPTLLMGATLPMLVAYRVNTTGHVGQSVSWLYFVNTLGGAIGAFLAGFVILRQAGLTRTAEVAAVLNFCCAVSVLLVWKIQPSRE